MFDIIAAADAIVDEFPLISREAQALKLLAAFKQNAGENEFIDTFRAIEIIRDRYQARLRRLTQKHLST